MTLTEIQRTIKHLNDYIRRIENEKNSFIRETQVALIVPSVRQSIASLEALAAGELDAEVVA